MNDNTALAPTVWYARILGIVLTVLGIWGLTLTTDQNVVKEIVGIDVNLGHNLVLLLTGVFGIFAGFIALAYVRTYALVLGVVYTLLGIWGVIAGEPFNPLGLFEQINSTGTMLHLTIGIVGLATWAMARNRSGERAV